ncbi:mitochondrial S-adenosylmethionine carrier protein isoform 5-T5 [Molossus nigricans]
MEEKSSNGLMLVTSIIMFTSKCGSPFTGHPRIVSRLQKHSFKRDSFLIGPVSLVGVLKSPLVLEARSCGGSLAVSSLRSVCRWICCCGHHPSGCGQNKNHVGEGQFQHREWGRPLRPARGLADAGAVGIICRCLPSSGSNQSGRFHLSWCLRSNAQLAVGTRQREPMNHTPTSPRPEGPAVSVSLQASRLGPPREPSSADGTGVRAPAAAGWAVSILPGR